MICGECGNEAAYAIKIRFSPQGEKTQECDRCGGFLSAAYLPDVYCPPGGYFNENLSHPDFPESRGGSWVPDKATGAYLLKKYGLQEAGDRRHGSNGFDRIAARHARESLKTRPSPQRQSPQGGHNE